MSDALDFTPDAPIRCRDFRIGCIGSGFIMADIHLAAYKTAEFPVVAIASRTREKAEAVAARWGIPTVHESPEALIEAGGFEILDIAYPARPTARAHPRGTPPAGHPRHPGAEAARP